MKRIPWKEWAPAVVAIGVFLLLSLTYFSPVLEGKRLVQGDKKNWQGMAQEVQEHRMEFDEEPLWTGSMFSGMPAYQISVKWTSNLMQKVHRVMQLGLPSPAGYLFLYMLGMFLLLRVLKIDPWLSVIGAIAFAFSSYFIIILEAGHNSKANAIGYMAPTLAGLYMIFRGRKLLGAVVFAFFLALELTMNHVQITYYLGFIMVLFGLAEMVRYIRDGDVMEFIGRSGLALVAVALALSCNLGSLWSTWEYGRYTTRGPSELTIGPTGQQTERTDGLDRDYIVDWSYGIDESLSLLVPNANGGPTGYIGAEHDALREADPRYRQTLAQMNQYWGDQRFTSGPVYLGAVVVLLMLLHVARLRGPELWWAVAALPVLIILVKINSSFGAGVLIILYLLAGLVISKGSLRYALYSAFILTLALSWGKNYMPLTNFFIDVVPGYSKFRAVTMILVVVQFSAALLAVLYLDQLLRNDKWDQERIRSFLIPVGALVLVLFTMVVAPDLWTDFVSNAERESFSAQAEGSPEVAAQVQASVDQLKQVRSAILSADSVRSLLFVVFGAALIFLFGKRMIKREVLIAGLGLLILFDLWSVDKRYLNNEKQRGQYMQWEPNEKAALPYTPNAADNAIFQQEQDAAVNEAVEARQAMMLAQKDGPKRLDPAEQGVAKFAALRRTKHYRVFNLNNPVNESRTSYFHKSVGGYHGAKLKRYQELIEFHLMPNLTSITNLLSSGTNLQELNDRLAGFPVLNMLNTRYLIHSPEQPPIRNLNALGPAWFVSSVKWVPSADEEIVALGTLDPSATAVIDERYRGVIDQATSDPSASVQLTSSKANELNYEVNSSQGGVVVFSEIHYDPDWQAYIDGSPVEHARANYVLRALQVPAGAHQITFKVESMPYKVGSKVSLVTSAFLILLMLGMLILHFKGTSGSTTKPA